MTSQLWDPISQQIKLTLLTYDNDPTQRVAKVNADGAPDYIAANVQERSRAYICDTVTEKMSNGDDPYLIV